VNFLSFVMAWGAMQNQLVHNYLAVHTLT